MLVHEAPECLSIASKSKPYALLKRVLIYLLDFSPVQSKSITVLAIFSFFVNKADSDLCSKNKEMKVWSYTYKKVFK